jgi:hypothetical protein
MNRLAALAIAAAFALPLAALAQETGPSHEETGHEEAGHEEAGHHVVTTGDLRLIHAWSRATDDDEALVFLEIENNGTSPAALTGGETAIAKTVEVVGFQLQNGAGTYVPLGEVPIAPGTEMVLAPEGVALRLSGLSQPLRQGETLALEIHLGDQNADVTVDIEAPDARQHSHAGHED